MLQFRIHHLRDELAKPPHVANHHQNVILEFLDFEITFSPLRWHQRCYSYIHTACIQSFFFALTLNLILFKKKDGSSDH